jgi:hypothetical protein
VFKKWKIRRSCMHHEPWIGDGERYAKSWIVTEHIDMGTRKMFWCTLCGKSWAT